MLALSYVLIGTYLSASRLCSLDIQSAVVTHSRYSVPAVPYNMWVSINALKGQMHIAQGNALG